MTALEIEVQGIKTTLQRIEERLEKLESLTEVIDKARQMMTEAQDFAETIDDLRQDTLLRVDELEATEYALKISPLDEEDRIESVEQAVEQLKGKASNEFNTIEKRLANLEHNISQRTMELFGNFSSEMRKNLDQINDYLSVVSAPVPDLDGIPNKFDPGSFEEEITVEEEAEHHLVGNLLSDPRFAEPLVLEEFDERIATMESVWEWLEDQNLVGGLADRLHRLEAALADQRESSKTLQKIEKRITNALEHGPDLAYAPLNLSTTPEELCTSLKKNNYFLALPTAHQIINHLQVRRILILQGPPGTGKSKLARLLPQILLPSVAGTSFSEGFMRPETSHFDVIGGLMQYGEQFGPSLGFLSESILASIEAKGRHWLILDEINRGDISAALSSVLDGINLDVGRLNHDYLFRERSNPRGSIPIPGAFRVIGTMNTFDEDQLFRFSEALSRRVAFIDIPPLSLSEELEIVDGLVSELSRRKGESSPAVLKQRYGIDRASVELLEIFRQVRALAQREPRHLFRYCEIGVGIVIDVFRYVFSEMTSDRGAQTEMVIDVALSDYLLSRLEGRDVELLEELKNSVFSAPRFKHCRKRLEKRIGELQVF